MFPSIIVELNKRSNQALANAEVALGMRKRIPVTDESEPVVIRVLTTDQVYAKGENTLARLDELCL